MVGETRVAIVPSKKQITKKNGETHIINYKAMKEGSLCPYFYSSGEPCKGSLNWNLRMREGQRLVLVCSDCGKWVFGKKAGGVSFSKWAHLQEGSQCPRPSYGGQSCPVPTLLHLWEPHLDKIAPSQTFVDTKKVGPGIKAPLSFNKPCLFCPNCHFVFSGRV